MFPRIYLAIDNCFASKRWTRPKEWMSVIRDLGVTHLEASADNECDPLYYGPEYMADWVQDVKAASAETGVTVSNLYSGHGTYATLGLAHTDVRVRDRILNYWLKPMCKAAGELDAGLGFFAHAFDESVLQDPVRYKQSCEDLYDRLAELAKYYAEVGTKSVGLEQMYTPHQVPWTIANTKELLKQVYRRSGAAFYITLDTGHQSGQRKFLRPSQDAIAKALRNCREGMKSTQLWMGPGRAYRLFYDALKSSGDKDSSTIQEIYKIFNDYQYMFAEYRDGDSYAWLEELGPYSPIIHLQQTDGKCSSHWPFTEEFNKRGGIFGDKVLAAIYAGYCRELTANLPGPVEQIYLTIEVFSATTDISSDILERLKQTVAYWRKFVPVDGQPLNEIISTPAK